MDIDGLHRRRRRGPAAGPAIPQRHAEGPRHTIVTAVASALDYAHKKGLLHRDVKPANILISDVDDEDERRILLTDFGIARNLDEVSGLTGTNMTVGTLGYTAPEQLMGYEIDGRADQYSLAATAYHLFAGSPVFPVSNPAVLINHHINTEPPPGQAKPELAALDGVLIVALAKNPNYRFASCGEFARALAAQVRAQLPKRNEAPRAATPPTRLTDTHLISPMREAPAHQFPPAPSPPQPAAYPPASAAPAAPVWHRPRLAASEGRAGRRHCGARVDHRHHRGVGHHRGGAVPLESDWRDVGEGKERRRDYGWVDDQ